MTLGFCSPSGTIRDIPNSLPHHIITEQDKLIDSSTWDYRKGTRRKGSCDPAHRRTENAGLVYFVPIRIPVAIKGFSKFY